MAERKRTWDQRLQSEVSQIKKIMRNGGKWGDLEGLFSVAAINKAARQLEETRALAELSPGAKKMRCKGCGHMVVRWDENGICDPCRMISNAR